MADPLIAAAQLATTALPREAWLSLFALGYFDFQAKKYLYRIHRERKTVCSQGNKQFSCCIAPEDSSCPDTDRIVAEFLLIKNNEEEYLKTANLTQIAGPRPTQVDGLRFHPDAFAMEYARIGDTVNTRRPTRYEVHRRIIPPRMITEGILVNMRNSDRLRGRRWPILHEHEALTIGLHRDIRQVDLSIDDVELTRSFDEFNARTLRRVAEQLTEAILNQPNIEAFFRVQDRNIEARTLDADTGIDISYIRHFDVRDYRQVHAIVAGILLR